MNRYYKGRFKGYLHFVQQQICRGLAGSMQDWRPSATAVPLELLGYEVLEFPVKT